MSTEVETEIQARLVQEQHDMARVLSLALRALSQRLLTLLAMLLGTGMFGWAMLQCTWPRVAAAVLASAALWCYIRLQAPGKMSE